MKISTKGRYALRMLLDLAINQQDGYIALKDIARRQNISKKYLEQIVPLLNKSGLLRANRGYQGGYMLSRPASQYTVGEILRLTEGTICPISCLESEVNSCGNASKCMWKGLYDVIKNYLDNITLQDIIDNNASLSGDNYCI